jgi:excisionase family DNA binding protein
MATQKLALKALDLMTTSDVAKELGVTIRSVQLWVEQGALEGWKTPGGHRRITRASFIHLASSRKQKTTNAANNFNLRVLILEKDEATQSMYLQTIKAWGLGVDLKISTNPIEALIDLSLQPPDLFITDLNLNEINALAMIKTLRNNDAFSDMRMAAVTNLSADDISARGGLPKRVRLYGKNPIPFWEIKELMAGLIESKQESQSA